MAAAAPRPKSPPASPDPCGRHRLQLAVDALHREIGFLEVHITFSINYFLAYHHMCVILNNTDSIKGRSFLAPFYFLLIIALLPLRCSSFGKKNNQVPKYTQSICGSTKLISVHRGTESNKCFLFQNEL